MTRTLVIGARRSPLAQIQALAVGNTLMSRDPGLRLKYCFSESSGDRSSDPSAARITQRGGFTEDLGRMLDTGAIHLAVHSWKDLPLRERLATQVVATLPRADCRDLILVRRDAQPQIAELGLRILSSSARRRLNLENFLHWALPVRPLKIDFVPVRGDIETRIAKLLCGDGDALVVAKAAIDRLIGADGPAAGSAARVQQALTQCRIIVLPLALSPAAPAQGALAIEVARGATELTARLSDINDADSWELVNRERAQAAQLGDDDSPLGITWLRFDYGDVEFVRGEHAGQAIERQCLHRRGAPLPCPANRTAVWADDMDSALFERIANPRFAAQYFGAHTGLLVARSDALPPRALVSDDAVVWTAGLATWRKLAARGIWVNGSDESLGETGASAIRPFFPHITRWMKLTHDGGFDTPHAETLATYRLQRCAPLPPVDNHSHFFWRSASLLREYLAVHPGLSRAWHGCGPGNSFRLASQWLGRERLLPFLSAAQFRAELLT